jgi:cell division protein FtsI/penicillin-binding protein 2
MLSIRALLYFFFIVFIAILVKLFFLQVLQPTQNATDYLQAFKLLPNRGKIYDRNGLPLAVNQTTYLLYVEPKFMKDKNDMVRKLDSVLHVGEATLSQRIDEKKVWVPIRHNLSQETRDQVLALKLPGTGFENEPIRNYPESSLSAHLLGFIGKNDQGEDTGYFGLEGFYEKELEGLPGYMKSERDVFNKPMFVGTQEKVDAQDGRDLYLTVDKSVQNIVKEKLVKAVEQYKAASACASVANPKTMEILSMVCIPDFDPARYYEASPEAYVNTTISDLYEPGSTFKPLMMAAALQEKKVKPDGMFDEAGAVHVSGYRIQNWNDKYEGEISMTRILEKSSNIGMVYISTKLGHDTEYEYLKKYGVGKATQIDLQGEATGFLRSQKDMYDIDYATAAFGQGISVTQIQLLRAFSSLVNGGYLMRPYVVREIHQGSKVRKRAPKVEEKVLSERTSEIMKKMLQSTVDNGEVKYRFPREYKIGGKTGTAQVAVQGKYDASKTIASFIGFAPVDNPQFIALVVVKEPKSSQWGSETAAPVFFDIAKDLFVYYNIVPEQ